MKRHFRAQVPGLSAGELQVIECGKRALDGVPAKDPQRDETGSLQNRDGDITFTNGVIRLVGADEAVEES